MVSFAEVVMYFIFLILGGFFIYCAACAVKYINSFYKPIYVDLYYKNLREAIGLLKYEGFTNVWVELHPRGYNEPPTDPVKIDMSRIDDAPMWYLDKWIVYDTVPRKRLDTRPEVMGGKDKYYTRVRSKNSKLVLIVDPLAY